MGGWFKRTFDPTRLDDRVKKLDPTTPEGQRALLYGGTAGMGAIANETLGDPLNFKGRIDARKAELEARAKAGDRAAQLELERQFFEQLAEDYRGVPESAETQARAEELYSRDMAPEIERGTNEATSAIAKGMAGRGMAQSGYNDALQSQALQAAAQERTRSRSRALDIAIGEGRSSIAGQGQIRGQGTNIATNLWQQAEAAHQNALARQAAERNEWRSLVGGIAGRAAGFALGGPIGAMAGGQLADGMGGGGEMPIMPAYLEDDFYLEG